MDKRIVLAIAGVAAVVAVVWLTTRGGEQGDGGKSLSATTPDSVTSAATGGDNASAGSLGARASDPPKGSSESRDAIQPGEVSPSPVAATSLPIDVSPSFEYLSKPASEMKDTDPMWTQWRRHQVLQSEPRDETWAPRIEESVRKSIEKSLTDRGYDTQRMDLPVVECRTQGCEIQASGRIENTQKDFMDLQQVMFSAMAGSLRNEFDDAGGSVLVGMSPDHQQFLYLAHLPRKKP